MRARPRLPFGVGRPVATFAMPRPARSWKILTTCCAEGRLRGCSHGLACVGAALCDDLVGGVLVGLVAVGAGDAAVKGVELVAGAEVGVVAGVAAQVLPA
jgi:hypothetical protein